MPSQDSIKKQRDIFTSRNTKAISRNQPPKEKKKLKKNHNNFLGRVYKNSSHVTKNV